MQSLINTGEETNRDLIEKKHVRQTGQIKQYESENVQDEIKEPPIKR